MDHAKKKPNKISQIVKLHGMVKKWRKLASSDHQKRSGNGVVPPKGFLAVCVGEEMRRFVIPTEYLGHVAFGMLLKEAEEEFGFHQEGVLRIPCGVSAFEEILKAVEEEEEEKEKIKKADSLSMMHRGNSTVQFCSSPAASQMDYCRRHSQSPICR